MLGFPIGFLFDPFTNITSATNITLYFFEGKSTWNPHFFKDSNIFSHLFPKNARKKKSYLLFLISSVCFLRPSKKREKPKTCWFRNSILIRPKRHRQSNAMATLIAGGLFATRVPAGSDWDVLGISGAKFVKTKTSASRKEKQPQGGKTHLSRNTFRGLVHSYKEHKSFFFLGGKW